jgi:hypothetical protein
MIVTQHAGAETPNYAHGPTGSTPRCWPATKLLGVHGDYRTSMLE